jgi:hypothetical protein
MHKAGSLLGLVAGMALGKEVGNRDLEPAPNVGPKILKPKLVRGAAEFVLRYKRQWHRVGVVDFALPRGARNPPWMAVILELLRERPRAWRVVTLKGAGGGKVYRVQWLWWGRCKGGGPR